MDIHKLTASQILNVPIDKVSKEERRNAKAINFELYMVCQLLDCQTNRSFKKRCQKLYRGILIL